ncbi:MAG TPA: hypothetical protein DCM71_07330 [Runella sp.]|nr:hypothetical protein [Runella sp.]
MKVIHTFTVPISLCFLENQSSFWNINQYNLHVLSSEHRGLLKEFGQKNSLTTFAIPFTRNKDILNSLSNVRVLYAYFREHYPTLVHGNTPKAAFLSMMAATFARVPVRVYEMHGLPLETARWPWKLFYWGIEKMTCSLATHVIAVSPSLRQSVIQKRLISAEKISVMHHGSCNGVDAKQKFNPACIDVQKVENLRKKWNLHPSQPIVGFVGRLTPDKGIQELYDAWQWVKQVVPAAKLLMVGDCDDRQPISQRLLSQLEHDASIVHINHQSDIASVYALIDFLVLPSYREGLGNVVLEAAAMGKPAVVSNVTGLKDAVDDNRTGTFCTPRSAQDLAAKMITYLQNPPLVQQHGQAAQLRVRKRFVPEDVWHAKLMLYRRLVAATESVTLPHVPTIFQTAD